MKRPRVVFLSVANHLGGGERSLCDLCAELRRQKNFSILVILPSAQGPLAEELRKARVPLRIVAMPKTLALLSRESPFFSLVLLAPAIPLACGYFLRLLVSLVALHPNALHTNGVKCHILGALLKPLLGIPVLWHIRDIFPNGFTKSCLRWLARFAQIQIIANSRATLEALHLPERTRVVYNGFPLPPPKATLTGPLKKISPQPWIGICAVLARWKGQDIFLDAAAKLVKEGRDLRFAIIGGPIYDTVGDRDYAKFLVEHARKLGIHDLVEFTGFTRDPFLYMRDLTVQVHASVRPEPFGRVIIEAWQAEVPVVAAAAGGILEIIEPEQTGLLYPPSNSTALAQAIARCLDNSSLRNLLVSRGALQATNRFSLSAHAAEIGRIYTSLLAK